MIEPEQFKESHETFFANEGCELGAEWGQGCGYGYSFPSGKGLGNPDQSADYSRLL